MQLTILDIKDELDLLQKIILEKKLKPEVVVLSKKQLCEHLDFKYKEYEISLGKIARKAQEDFDKIVQYDKDMDEVKRLFEKQLEYHAKLPFETQNLMPKYSPEHLNRLQQEIIELQKRQRALLANEVNIEAARIQLERFKWLTEAINNLRQLKNVIVKSNKSDKYRLAASRFIKAVSFVLSIYGVFSLVELLKNRIHMNEFSLNLIAGITVYYTLDHWLEKIKENVFWKNAGENLINYKQIIETMQAVDNGFASYNF